MMSLIQPSVYEIDTRQNSELTVFDGSKKEDADLAKQFWNSVVLLPPVESSLVCPEINQRTKGRLLNSSQSKGKAVTKAEKELNEAKVQREKEYEEFVQAKNTEDEQKLIECARDTHNELRHLFLQQAKINRLKNEKWRIPNNREEMDLMRKLDQFDTFEYDDQIEKDRQLVMNLPD
ncbi:unnamed protein product [Didymodactylos carnosus]|uniref:Cilia- and flagella-associated protein HOATZ n=1 Tax=Didymodactylos carnosus TaxID=1234261 RepID=A0A813VAG1_9BILA|nr:unnamed protein product [Didymodactylos carnosus]CAF3629778.1 unnamed protein product [Didymodactylos carnosus]